MKDAYPLPRRKTRQIYVGKVPLGGNAPIVVQSMTKTDTRDISSTVEQINQLEKEGCEIVRVAIPDQEAAEKLGEIKRQINIPLVADIHFDYRLALKALEQGADGLRLNPGNISQKEHVALVAKLAKEKNVPIRLGINAGSLEKRLHQKYGGPTAEALVESALNHVHFLEDLGFDLIKISLKASDVWTTLKAYQSISELTDYPLHIGITEAGPLFSGSIKSAVGLGILLYQGIGDTIRVSLTAEPIWEVRAAYHILKALGLRQRGIDLISCPLCGRKEADLFPIVKEIEEHFSGLPDFLRVAVMGCPVNGPGEAREADVGLAVGRGMALLFRYGEVIRQVKSGEMVSALIAEVEKILKERKD
ncbi:MAG: flavodoxin-dependent (E)-4-hydroxy-3-methylbut-2-enyl-diphosphate synthase [Thermodesulfobacteriota bacterium]